MDGFEVYLGSVELEDEIVIPAMVVPDKKLALYSYNGEAYQSTLYSYIIIEPKLQFMEWISDGFGKVPRTAYIGGQTRDYGDLYIGRVFIDGFPYAGAIDPTKG